MEGLGELLKQVPLAASSLRKGMSAWHAGDALNVMRVYRYLDRFIDVWSGIAEEDKRLLVSWLLAADKAWRSVSKGLLPMPLLRTLQAREKIDGTKVAACLERLLGSGSSTQRLPSVVVARTEAAVRPYHPERDGMLPAGTRVRHALHGTGKILHFGSENSLAYVEIAFDKGRSVRLLLQHALFDVLE